MNIVKGFFKYVILVPLFFVIMCGMAAGASGALAYFMVICYAKGMQMYFWLFCLSVALLIIWAIALQCVSVWFPKKKRRRKINQPMASYDSDGVYEIEQPKRPQRQQRIQQARTNEQATRSMDRFRTYE